MRTWTCDIWSCGMVKNSGLFVFFSPVADCSDPRVASGKRNQNGRHHRHYDATDASGIVSQPFMADSLFPTASFNCSSAVICEAMAWR